MQVTLLRRLGSAALAILVASLAACGGGGASTPGGGEIGASGVAPAVTAQPVDASITAPFKATFIATASGSPVPTVQWQRSADAGITWAAIAGATSASYTTPALTLGDNAARFRAVFTNEAGTATSNAGGLTVSVATLTPGLSLVAGDIGGPGNVDGTGAAAHFDDPVGMTSDAAGNLYVADWHEHNIRKITPDGVVTVFAGTATGALSGLVDDTGTAARFSGPTGVACDAAGNVFVADFGNYAVRKITPAGVVTTFAGGAYGTTDVDGVGTAAKFGAPIGVAVDSHGNVFVTDQDLHSIRKITPAGVVSTFAGVSSGVTGTVVDGTGASARFIAPQGLAIDAADNLYVGDGAVLRKVTPGAVVTTVPNTSAITYARGITVDPAGNVFVADTDANVVRKIDSAGVMTTFAGTVSAQFNHGYADGTGAAAILDAPAGIAHDAAGNVYVGEEGNEVIRKITPAAVVTTFAGAVGKTGHDDGTGTTARFAAPQGVAVDSSGNLFVADTYNDTIRKVTQGGVVSTYAGSANVSGSADGTLATARFRQPLGLAFDASRNLYITDSGNFSLRKIAPDGTVSTLAGSGGQSHVDGTGVAASFASLDAVAVDAAGNVFVAESSSNTVRKVTPDGVVTTLAGQVNVPGSADGTGTAASFGSINGLAFDPSGNLVVADATTLRRITPAGVVTTLAGLPGVTGTDDGTGAAARFKLPRGLTTDAAGNVYVSDFTSVRKVTPAGVVTTVVGGTGSYGLRLGTNPSLAPAPGLAWLPTGQLAITSANAVLLFTLP